MANSFGAQIGEWAAKTPQRIQAVRKRSIELLAEDMTMTKPQGGLVPFDTGNLARSLLASTDGMPKTSDVPSIGSNVGVVVAVLEPTQVIWLGYQATYARRMNYGFVGADSKGRVYNQAGNHFVEGAIARWPQIVAQAAREAKDSAERRNA